MKERDLIPDNVYEVLERRGFTELRPSQKKSVAAGLFQDKNLLVCTPTASGKTLVGELAALNAILHNKGKAVYVVPLRALASEKFRQFKKDYPGLRIALSSGDLDSVDAHLGSADVIITTSEKLDSLLRHKAEWMQQVKVLVVDEIHLLNDPHRGPTLEIVITILRQVVPELQIIGLSATIGNPQALASWLDAALVEDSWRPVELKRGILLDNTITFEDKNSTAEKKGKKSKKRS